MTTSQTPPPGRAPEREPHDTGRGLARFLRRATHTSLPRQGSLRWSFNWAFEGIVYVPSVLDAMDGLESGDVTFAGTKGVTSGEVYSITTIRAGGTDSYPPMTYTGGEYADVYIEGATSSADLNVFVRDAQGRLVCSDTDISAIAYCGWRPGKTEGFTVEVTNRSGTPTSYSLITN